jgi:drug/metabolite transporter (DMT)-like permease
MHFLTACEFVLLAAIWGASFLLMKLGATEFGPFVTAFLRVFLATLILLPLLWWRGQFSALRDKWGRVLAVGALNSGLPFVLFGFAVLHINTGLTSILNATTPLWGAVVAWLWLRDKPGHIRVLGLVIGFAGVAALAWDKATFKAEAASPGLAVLATLAATLCYGISASFTKKYMQGIPPLASATGSQIGASIVLLMPAATHLPEQNPSLNAWLAITALALFCTAIAYILFFRIITKAGPARAVAVTFLIPVFGVVYGAVFLQEAITPTMLVCGLIIILGTAQSTGFLKWEKSSIKD